MRTATGGWVDYFINIFMQPNINRTLRFRLHEFYNSQGYYSAAIQGARRHDGSWFVSRPTEHFLTDFPSPEDFYHLDRFYTVDLQAWPSHHSGFNGQIWLLVGSHNFSGAEQIAAFVRYTSFATLVGEPTGGLAGGWGGAYLPLPNTGLIIRFDFTLATNYLGQNFDEFSTQPYYFNFRGMDALETTLTIIENRRSQ